MGEIRNSVSPISVIIFTLNEEIHLPHCLQSISWCDDIVVVDSYSTDQTEQICKQDNVRLFKHKFELLRTQRNWALENINFKHDWILLLDADEKVTPELYVEICKAMLLSQENIAAYRIKRRFHIWGRWLRYSSLYPIWFVRLVHKDRVKFFDFGHGESQVVKGQILELKGDLIDENLKGIDAWFDRQNLYSTREAKFELQAAEKNCFKISEFFSSDPLVRHVVYKKLVSHLPFRPLLYFIYCYILRLGFLDGRDGFVFCLMKALYQRMVLIKKYDLRRKSHDRSEGVSVDKAGQKWK